MLIFRKASCEHCVTTIPKRNHCRSDASFYQMVSLIPCGEETEFSLFLTVLSRERERKRKQVQE